MEPSDGEETIWMFFSLLTLPVDRQIEIIGGVPHQGEPLVGNLRDNAGLLLSTMQEYYIGWWDEFAPECPNAEVLFDFINKMTEPGSYENFTEGDQWKKLRRLAKAVLDEVGLDPWPVPNRIDFNDYIEVHPEDIRSL
jgi:hypothetical protein